MNKNNKKKIKNQGRNEKSEKSNKNQMSKPKDDVANQLHSLSMEETSGSKFEDDPLPDFSSLIKNPISLGGHFKFKSEKEWDVALTNKYSEYFSLNLGTLTTNIMTIPFYERHEISLSLFTSKEIEAMNRHMKLSKTLNKDHFTSSMKNEREKTNNNDLDQGKKIKNVHTSNEVVATTASDEVNLDEWLDEFLDS